MEKQKSLFSHAIALLGILSGTLIWVLPYFSGNSTEISRVGAVVVVAVSLWASRIFPEYFTAIIFFFLAITFTNSGAPIVFSGFHSAAVWMIFGGLIIGLAVQETGFGQTLSSWLLRIFPRNYFGILCGCALIGCVLSFVIPSNTGRIVIMMPIFMALADQIGFTPGSHGRAGLGLAVVGGSVYPSLAILPSAVPNLGWLGAVESIHGLKITYAEYLIANFPVIGIISTITVPLLCYFLFPDRPRKVTGGVEASEASAHQTRLVILLIGALGLWLTDFEHGISPAWIALGAGVICMLPRVGMLSPPMMLSGVSYAPWFFVAGVIGMGAVVSNSGLGNFIGDILFSRVPLTPGADFANFVVVSVVGMLIGVVTTIPGQPAIMTTLATDISLATDWPIKTVLMLQPLTWAMSLFAYQLPPFILAAHLGGIPMKNLSRLILAMCAVAWLIMLPLLFFWWRIIGYLS